MNMEEQVRRWCVDQVSHGEIPPQVRMDTSDLDVLEITVDDRKPDEVQVHLADASYIVNFVVTERGG